MASKVFRPKANEVRQLPARSTSGSAATVRSLTLRPVVCAGNQAFQPVALHKAGLKVDAAPRRRNSSYLDCRPPQPVELVADFASVGRGSVVRRCPLMAERLLSSRALAFESGLSFFDTTAPVGAVLPLKEIVI
jgi:hypothetical protein